MNSEEARRELYEEAKSLIDPLLEKYGCTFENLCGKSRAPLYEVVRQEICVRLRRQRGWHLAKIGRLLGKHHATVINAIKRWDEVHGKQNKT